MVLAGVPLPEVKIYNVLCLWRRKKEKNIQAVRVTRSNSIIETTKNNMHRDKRKWTSQFKWLKK